MYTMTGALALAAAWAGRDLAARSPRVRRAALAVGGGVLIAAGWTDIRRNVDYRSEIELFTADLRARPSSAAAALRLGNSYVEAGDFGEAEHFLRLATTLAPASSEVWYDLGTFFGRERKDYRAALACFERSTAANPRNLLALLNGSVAALALGDLDYAWRLLTSAQQLQPGNSHVEYNMALVEAARGDNREALTRLQALSRNDPGDENVRSTLKRLLAVMQD
jgi:Flp pilus assembly protein TadD